MASFTDSIAAIFADFKAAHPEDFPAEGKLRVCIGGGAGFIGSHIAQHLKAVVSKSLVILSSTLIPNSQFFLFLTLSLFPRAVMLSVLIGKRMNS